MKFGRSFRADSLTHILAYRKQVGDVQAGAGLGHGRAAKARGQAPDK